MLIVLRTVHFFPLKIKTIFLFNEIRLVEANETWWKGCHTE